MGVWVCGLRVDLVGEDAFVVGLGEGQVEPDEQLGQGLAFSANQHGQSAISIAGHGDVCANRSTPTDEDPRPVVAEPGPSPGGFFGRLVPRRGRPFVPSVSLLQRHQNLDDTFPFAQGLERLPHHRTQQPGAVPSLHRIPRR